MHAALPCRLHTDTATACHPRPTSQLLMIVLQQHFQPAFEQICSSNNTQNNRMLNKQANQASWLCCIACMLCRLFTHSQAGSPLVLLHEVDLCVVGVASLCFGGLHYTSLAVGSMEATTHLLNLDVADDGYLEPPQVMTARALLLVLCRS